MERSRILSFGLDDLLASRVTRGGWGWWKNLTFLRWYHAARRNIVARSLMMVCACLVGTSRMINAQHARARPITPAAQTS